VQPEHKQLALPFDDEVLVILYKRVVPVDDAAHHWRALDYTAQVRAKSLGMRITSLRSAQRWEDGELRIQIRAEAERP
jgi:hypothetical protein